MQIERTDDEILIRVAANTNLGELKRLFDYIKFREIVSKSKGTQQKIDDHAQKLKINLTGKTNHL